jgi:hypothetical protein
MPPVRSRRTCRGDRSDAQAPDVPEPEPEPEPEPSPMLGQGPFVAVPCEDEPDEPGGRALGAAEPEGAVVMDGVVVLDDPVAAVATVTPSPRARPTELPTIPAANSTRLCLMVLLNGSDEPEGSVWATEPTGIHSTIATSRGPEPCLRIPAESGQLPQNPDRSHRRPG